MEKFRINLQLFADPNTQTTELSTVGNNLSPEMKTFYSKDLIEMLGANLVHLQFGDPVSLPKHGGKTIEWRKWTKFEKALNPLEEGVTPNGTPIDVGTVTARIFQYGDYTTVSDLLEMTAIDNVIVEVTSKHAENARLTLDTVVRNKLVAGTNVLWADNPDGTKVESRKALTKDCKLTLDMIARAAATLKKANAPKIDGSYVAIVHPSVAYDLMRSEEWIDVNKYSNATKIFNGEIGKLYGVRFVETTEAAIFSGENGGAGGIAIYATLFLGKGAYKVVKLDSNNLEVIVKNRGSSGTSDPLDQRSTIGWKAIGFGAEIAIPEYIVRVESGSYFSDEDKAN